MFHVLITPSFSDPVIFILLTTPGTLVSQFVNGAGNLIHSTIKCIIYCETVFEFTNPDNDCFF